MGLLQFIADQNRASSLRDYATQAYGQGSPQEALAQGSPDLFAKFVADQSQKQVEQQAIQQFYGANQPQPTNPSDQALPADTNSGNAASQAISAGITPPQQSPLSRMAGAINNLPPALQTVAGQQMMFQNPGGVSGAAALTGDDFLKTLPPAVASQVKAISDGRIAVTSRMQSSPGFQPLMNAVMTYNPDFDAADAQARQKFRVDITSGPGSKKLNSLNTAINTLQQADDASQKLGDALLSGTPLSGMANWVRNEYLSASNNPALVTYNNLAKTAADETTNAVTTGGGTGADRSTREGIFKAGQSQEARHAAFLSAIQELKSRIEPIAESASNALHTSVNPIQLLSPTALQAYTKLTGENAPVASINGVTGDISPAPQQAQTESASAPNISSQNSDPRASSRKAAILAQLKSRGLLK